jgi:hypothetical protein
MACRLSNHSDFCTMIGNLQRPVSPTKYARRNTQQIVHELFASEHSLAKTNLGKEKVKFWMLHQPLTSMGTAMGQQKVRKR